jgi:hypothetical protein
LNRLSSAILAAALVGCSSPVPRLENRAHESAPPREIDGWIGFAPLPPTSTSTSWLPVAAPAVLIVAPGEPVPRTPLVVIAGEGARPAVLRGAIEVPYGCDHGKLDAVALDVEPRPSPGVVLVLPSPMPAGWAPSEIPVLETERKVGRMWHADPLWITLDARDGIHATFTIAHDNVVYSVDVEKAYMDGDDHAPIDLAQDQPGLPTPIAAFKLASGGPELVVLRTPGHEGNAFSAVVIDGARGTLTKLASYLYQCAF